MRLFLILLAIPLIEIALFVQIGGAIGLWATLALVLATGMTGVLLLRRQGLETLRRIRSQVEAGGDPSEAMMDGALVLLAGLLLILPGFLTDTLGLILLIPAARAALRGRARGGLRAGTTVFVRRVHMPGGPGPRRPDPGVVDAEYEVLDDVPPSERGASGWTRPQR